MTENENYSDELIETAQTNGQEELQELKSLSGDEQDLMEIINDTIANHIQFQHIYNGMISFEDRGRYYCLAEFKIKCHDIELPYDKENKFKYEVVFHGVNFKCGWFYVDVENEKLVGPFEFDAKKYIENNKRYINFYPSYKTFENSEFIEITNVDNSPENLIDNDELPQWMKRDLLSHTHIILNRKSVII